MKQIIKYNRLFFIAWLLVVSCPPAESQRRGGRPGGGGGGSNRQPMHGGATQHNMPERGNRDVDHSRNINNAARGSNNTNISGNNININVDRSHDVNVVNNRNTVVRRNNV